MSILIQRINVRSTYGNEQLEAILGFKQFLKTANVDRIRHTAGDNPDYYYSLLPYAQVLGISRRFMHSFDTLHSQPPEWITLEDDVCWNHNFYMCMNTSFTSMTVNPSTTSNSSSDYSSYDSGSSGGGSGGGGGSSW